MATANRFLQLLETGEATLDEALEAIGAFERELTCGRGVQTRACVFCGQPFVASRDEPAPTQPGDRAVCWRRACRQELRAHGQRWAEQRLSGRRSAFDARR